jgi:hypothetical protein
VQQPITSSGEAPERLGRQRARLLDRNGDGLTCTCGLVRRALAAAAAAESTKAEGREGGWGGH